MDRTDGVVGTDAFEEVDGIPVIGARRRAIAHVRGRLAEMPVLPAVSAAAGGLVVGAAAAGLARQQKKGGRTLLPARRQKGALDGAQALELTRIVATRTVHVTVQTFVPLPRQR